MDVSIIKLIGFLGALATLGVACGEDPPVNLEDPGPEAVSQAALVGVNGDRQVALECWMPSALAARPLVLVGHGFLLLPTQYDSYAQHLGSHGFVSCTVDFVISLTPNHALWATDYRTAIDAVLAANLDPSGPFFGKIDPQQIGLAGHSLGGKLAVLAAKNDSRVRAVFGIDPVDSQVPDASALLPLPIPIGLLGETTDATAKGQACAPAADNYVTFFEAASSPALEVTVVGANHTSFLDDLASCDLACAFCNPATAKNEDVLALTRGYLTAFFGRYLAAREDYDSYLDGVEAEARYVSTGRVLLRSR